MSTNNGTTNTASAPINLAGALLQAEAGMVAQIKQGIALVDTVGSELAPALAQLHDAAHAAKERLHEAAAQMRQAVADVTLYAQQLAAELFADFMVPVIVPTAAPVPTVQPTTAPVAVPAPATVELVAPAQKVDEVATVAACQPVEKSADSDLPRASELMGKPVALPTMPRAADLMSGPVSLPAVPTGKVKGRKPAATGRARKATGGKATGNGTTGG